MIADVIAAALQPAFPDQVWPVVRPQGHDTYPCVVYQHVGNYEEELVCAGGENTFWRVQVSVLARTYTASVAGRKAVIDALKVLPQYRRRDLDQDFFDSDNKLFVWQLDFTFRAPEA
jgi:hypothetical protein